MADVTERRIVGTADGCDLRIDDAPYMSSRHFVLIRDDNGSVYVEDLGSTNGTEVHNGMGWVKAYSPTRIGPGCKILAGRVLFKIGTAGDVSVIKDVSLFDRDRI